MLKEWYIIYSSLKDFEFIKIVNILANNALKFPIILINKIVLIIIVPIFCIFYLLKNLKFNNSGFKVLLIDFEGFII